MRPTFIKFNTANADNTACIHDDECTDSSSGVDKYFTAGNIDFWINGVHNIEPDKCINGNSQLVEYQCSTPIYETVSCPSNSGCSNGACVCDTDYSLDGGVCVKDCSSSNCGACLTFDNCDTATCDWDGNSCEDPSNACDTTCNPLVASCLLGTKACCQKFTYSTEWVDIVFI